MEADDILCSRNERSRKGETGSLAVLLLADAHDKNVLVRRAQSRRLPWKMN